AQTGATRVAWEDESKANVGIEVRRLASSGTTLGAELRVNDALDIGDGQPALGADRQVGFVVAWSDIGTDAGPSYFGVRGQRFDSSGTATGASFQVDVYTTYDVMHPHVAVSGTGAFVLVWTDVDVTFPSTVEAQRFDAAGSALAGQFVVSSSTEL